MRELFSRRSMESFLAQLEARRTRKVESPLPDMAVGETGPATKKAKLTLDEGTYMYMYSVHSQSFKCYAAAKYTL